MLKFIVNTIKIFEMYEIQLILVLLTLCTYFENKCYAQDQEQQDLAKMVKIWAENLGKELHYIAEAATRRGRVADSFKQTKVVFEKGNKITEDIADKLRVMMAEKEKAVKRIVEKAEYLSFYRKTTIFENSTFDYYNSDNITNTTTDSDLEQMLLEDRKELEQHFKCNEEYNNRAIIVNPENEEQTVSHLHLPQLDESEEHCKLLPYVERPEGYFRHLPLIYHSNFEREVNLNFSVVRVATSIYDREEDILNDVRWSEALDLVFKKNYEEDPTLIWQYFAGTTGFLRHYPAIKWSDEQYERTYEFRTRAWYLESISSPKDVIIILDMTGSMWQYKWIVAKFLVNNILDTLGDNDYVNVYLYNYDTRPLVKCFNYTLMQAHEENLRLLRESLNEHVPDKPGQMVNAFKLAFSTLEHYRNTDNIAHCNQMIMLIADGIDYEYNPAELFDTHNRTEFYTPVRVFTFLIGTSDELQMIWIACANMGYYVNVSRDADIAEKVVKYLTVLSRPLNMNGIKPEPVWTGAYVDLADRRITNWLWQKHEGNTQRKIYIDYTKEAYEQYNCIFDHNMHFLNESSHEYEKYLQKPDFNYMTTVSLPVYDLRSNATAILGVAGIDVPIEFIKMLTMPHKIGVNGYAFIVTNNGLLLLHPDHRKEFENNIKPTFNRVDLTEAELIDDTNEPRDFNKSLLEMRDKIVKQMTGYGVFNVKVPIDNMKRILLSRRYYFYTKIGPFSLVVTFPDNYGFHKIKYDIKNPEMGQITKHLSGLKNTKNWKIHPEWMYCKHFGKERFNFKNPEEELLHFINEFEHRSIWNKYCQPELINTLILDAKMTEWFEDRNNQWRDILKKYHIRIVFLATHTGLTRWKTLDDEEEPEFIKTNNKAIDEIWYKRAVEYNYASPRSFVYSVPFEISLEKELLVTGSNAIFRDNGQRKSPPAVVGFEFSHFTLESMFKRTTSQCGGKSCQHTCDSEELTCFVLDNNAYIVVSDTGHTSEFIGNVRPDIMKHLVENGIYRKTRFVDYQDICYLKPPEPESKTKSPASKNITFLENVLGILKWAMATIIYFANLAFGAAPKESPCLRAITTEYVKRAINKTLPTPCDRQRWLYTLDRDTYTNTNDNMFTTPDCLWPYIVQPIPDSNLILLVVNGPCSSDMAENYENHPYTPEAQDLKYNLSMPCYIATKNNYTRRQYIKCINHHKKENSLNLNRYYCGITWN